MDDKFEYFMDQTNDRLSSMEKKLDALISFRFMLIGASLTLSTVVSLLIALLVRT